MQCEEARSTSTWDKKGDNCRELLHQKPKIFSFSIAHILTQLDRVSIILWRPFNQMKCDGQHPKANRMVGVSSKPNLLLPKKTWKTLQVSFATI